MGAAFLDRLREAAARWRSTNLQSEISDLRSQIPTTPPCPDCDKDAALAKMKLAAGLPINIGVAFPCVARAVVIREVQTIWACCDGPIREMKLDECVICARRRW